MTEFYVLFLWGDVDPHIHGPYECEAERNAKARALRAEHGEGHGIYPMAIDSCYAPSVGTYSGGFFDEQ